MVYLNSMAWSVCLFFFLTVVRAKLEIARQPILWSNMMYAVRLVMLINWSNMMYADSLSACIHASNLQIIYIYIYLYIYIYHASNLKTIYIYIYIMPQTWKQYIYIYIYIYIYTQENKRLASDVFRLLERKQLHYQ